MQQLFIGHRKEIIDNFQKEFSFISNYSMQGYFSIWVNIAIDCVTILLNFREPFGYIKF